MDQKQFVDTYSQIQWELKQCSDIFLKACDKICFNKYAEAKQEFDQYYTKKDELLVKLAVLDVRRFPQQINQENFDFIKSSQLTMDQINLLSSQRCSDLIERASSIEGFAIQQDNYSRGLVEINGDSIMQATEFITPIPIDKVIIASRYLLQHNQLTLLNQKVNFYTRIGMGHLITELKKSLFRSNQSIIMKITEDNFDMIIRKARSEFKLGRTDRAFQIMQSAINTAENEDDKCEAYHLIASMMKNVNGLNSILNYDQVIQRAWFNRGQIVRSRQQALMMLSRTENIQNRQNMLNYLQQRIDRSSQVHKIQRVIQKAIFLKNIDAKTQAIQTYMSALNLVNETQTFIRNLMYQELAYHCIDMMRFDEAIHYMTVANSGLNYNQKNVDRFLKKLKLRLNSNDPRKILPNHLMIKRSSDHPEFIVEELERNSFFVKNLPYETDPDQFALKALMAKKYVNVNLALDIAKRGLRQTQIQQEKINLHLLLAEWLKETNANSFQIIFNFDQAIKMQHDQRLRSNIVHKRKQTLELLSRNGNLSTHHQLLNYMDQQISRSKGIHKMDKLIQKAQFLRNIQAYNQAVETFSIAIEGLNQSQTFKKRCILKQFAYFYLSMNMFEQAISTFNEANTLCPDILLLVKEDNRFVRILKSNRQSPRQLQSLKTYQILTDRPFVFFEERTTDTLKRQANRKRKQGRIQQAIKLFKQSIKFQLPGQQLSQSYLKLANYLQLQNQGNIQIIEALDNAIINSQYDKDKIYVKRKVALTKLCKLVKEGKSSLEAVQNYYTKKQSIFSGHKLIQMYFEVSECYIELNMFSDAIHMLDLALRIIDGNIWPMQKSNIYVKQGHLYGKLNNVNQAIRCFDNAISFQQNKVVEKFKFFWKKNMTTEANSMLKTEKNKRYLLFTKGKLLQKEAQKLPLQNFRTQGQWLQRKNELILESIKAFDNCLRLTNDYKGINKILDEQYLSFKLKSPSTDQLNRFQLQRDVILKQAGLATDFSELKNLTLYFARSPSPKKMVRLRQELINELLTDTQLFTFKRFMDIGEKYNFYYSWDMQFVLRGLLKKFWSQQKFKQAFNLFMKMTFIDKSYTIIDENNEFYIFRRFYEILNLFEMEKYEGCLASIEDLKRQNSEQIKSLLSISLYEVSNLSNVLQKILILCKWHTGQYIQSSQTCADLIFAEGNFIRYIDLNKSQREQHFEKNLIAKLQDENTYKPLVMYNSLRFSKKRENYKECLRKAQQLEDYLQGQIKDPSFHFEFAIYYYKVGYEIFKRDESISYVEWYCLFMKKYQNYLLNVSHHFKEMEEVNIHYKDAYHTVKETFHSYIQNIECDISMFRDLCYQKGEDPNRSEKLKKYIISVDEKFDVCGKILKHNVIQDLENTSSIKRQWQNICKVIYKDILGLDIQECYSNIKQVIEDVKLALQKHVMINKQSITKEIIDIQKKRYQQQIEALVDERVKKSLSQIQKSFTKTKNLIEKIKPLVEKFYDQEAELEFAHERIDEVNKNIQGMEKRIVRQIVLNQIFQDEQFKLQKQQSGILVDMTKKFERKLHENMSLEDIELSLNSVYEEMKNQISTRPQKNKQQVKQICQVARTKLDKLKNLPSLDSEKVDSFLLTRQSQLQSNQIYKDMIKKALQYAQDLQKNQSKLQSSINSLQSIVENQGNVFQLNKQLLTLSDLVNNSINLEKKQILKDLISQTDSQQVFQINLMRKDISSEIEKNLSRLESTMQMEFHSSKQAIEKMRGNMSRMQRQIQQFKRQERHIINLRQSTQNTRLVIFDLAKKISQIYHQIAGVDSMDIMESVVKHLPRKPYEQTKIVSFDQLGRQLYPTIPSHTGNLEKLQEREKASFNKAGKGKRTQIKTSHQDKIGSYSNEQNSSLDSPQKANKGQIRLINVPKQQDYYNKQQQFVQIDDYNPSLVKNSAQRFTKNDDIQSKERPPSSYGQKQQRTQSKDLFKTPEVKPDFKRMRLSSARTSRKKEEIDPQKQQMFKRQTSKNQFKKLIGSSKKLIVPETNNNLFAHDKSPALKTRKSSFSEFPEYDFQKKKQQKGNFNGDIEAIDKVFQNKIKTNFNRLGERTYRKETKK